MPDKIFSNTPIRYISEYFLGTETHKWYNQRRSFYREFLEGNTRKQKLKELRKSEIFEIASGRAVWDMISLTAIATSIFMKKPLYPLFLSEGARCLCMSICYYTRTYDKLIESIIKRDYKSKRKIEKRGSEGEEWKNPDKYHLEKQLEDIIGEEDGQKV